MTDYAALLARHDYALVDRDGIYPEAWHSDFPLIPLVPENLSGDADKMPALLPLESLDDKITRELLEHLQHTHGSDIYKERLIACLLSAPGLDLASMQKHLERRLETFSPQGQFLLRYYDPRAFIHLRRVMALPFMRALYGPINTWTVPFQDEWLELPAPGEGVKREFWGVNAEERAALDRVGYINMALKELKRHRGQPSKNLTEYAGFAAKVDQAIVVAMKEFKIHATNDLTAFALHALIHSEHFYRHPDVRKLLNVVRNDKTMSYVGLIRAITAQKWTDIAAAYPSFMDTSMEL